MADAVLEKRLTFSSTAGPWAECNQPPSIVGPGQVQVVDDGDGKALRLAMNDATGGGLSIGPRFSGRVVDVIGAADRRMYAHRWAVKFPLGFAFGKAPATGKIGGLFHRKTGWTDEPGGGEQLGVIGVQGFSIRFMYKNGSNQSIIGQNNNTLAAARRIGLIPYMYLPGLVHQPSPGEDLRGAWPIFTDPLTGAYFVIDVERWLFLEIRLYVGSGANTQDGWFEFWAGYEGEAMRRLVINDSQWSSEVTGKPMENPTRRGTRVTTGPTTGRIINQSFSVSASWDPIIRWLQQNHHQGGGSTEKTGGSWRTKQWEWWALNSADDTVPAPNAPVNPNPAGNFVGYRGDCEEGASGADLRGMLCPPIPPGTWRLKAGKWAVGGTTGATAGSFGARLAIRRENGTLAGVTATATVDRTVPPPSSAASDKAFGDPLTEVIVTGGERIEIFGQLDATAAGGFARQRRSAPKLTGFGSMFTYHDPYGDGIATTKPTPVAEYDNTPRISFELEAVVDTPGQPGTAELEVEVNQGAGMPDLILGTGYIDNALVVGRPVPRLPASDQRTFHKLDGRPVRHDGTGWIYTEET